MQIFAGVPEARTSCSDLARAGCGYHAIVDELEAQHRLERFRGSRVVRGANLDISAALSARTGEIARRRRAVGGVGKAWGEVVPAELAARVLDVRLRRDVVTVRVADDAARYELDRWLRSGGWTALINASSTTIRRVKIVV